MKKTLVFENELGTIYCEINPTRSFPLELKEALADENILEILSFGTNNKGTANDTVLLKLFLEEHKENYIICVTSGALTSEYDDEPDDYGYGECMEKIEKFYIDSGFFKMNEYILYNQRHAFIYGEKMLAPFISAYEIHLKEQ